LVADKNGALYGTTYGGGTARLGAVFKLTPGSAYTETILHSFLGGTDGAYPYTGLLTDTNGALYGATAFGGPSNNGTVFKVTP
jgi:uncharacterized repeat protein (TIGR03803 family)